MKKQIAAYLLLLSFGLMLFAFLSKAHGIAFLALLAVLCSFFLTFGDDLLGNGSGIELLEMAVSIIGTNGFFILALLLGIGSGQALILAASFAGLVLYYWSYIRIFPKEMRRSILCKK